MRSVLPGKIRLLQLFVAAPEEEEEGTGEMGSGPSALNGVRVGAEDEKARRALLSVLGANLFMVGMGATRSPVFTGRVRVGWGRREGDGGGGRRTGGRCGRLNGR